MVGCGGDDNPGGGGGNGTGGNGGGGGHGFFNPNINYGSFTDSRDGKTYRTVQIGTQTWMAENLNFNASGSVCYNNSPDSCAKYGRLYDWETVMNGASSSSSSPSGVQGICPVGWHVPSDAEWETLVNFAGGSSTAGTQLKSTTGWNTNSGHVPGTDSFGFSALPGGFGYGSNFGSVGSRGYWWSATENGAAGARYRVMYWDDSGVNTFWVSKASLNSVRCLQD
jgi:uncharacterized protein (TIGR02145 family)